MMKHALIILLFVLSGCSVFMEKPTVNVKKLYMTGVDKNGAAFEMLLSVSNPNSFSIDVTGYTYDLFVSNIPLTRGEGHDAIGISGKSVTDVRLPLRVEYRDLLKILQVDANPNQLPYQLKASINIGTSFGNKTIPVAKNGTISLPKMFPIERFLKQLH